MTDKQWRLLYALVAIAGAVLIGAWKGAPLALNTSRGLWLDLVIVTIVSAFLFEPFFTGGGAAVTNGLVAILSAVAAGLAGPTGWWWFLVALAVVSVGAAIYTWVEKGAEVDSRRRLRNKAIRLVGSTLGSWRVLLVMSTVLALSTFNEFFDGAWLSASVSMLFSAAATRIPPHQIVGMLRGASPSDETYRPTAERTFPPSELILLGDLGKPAAPGTSIQVKGSGRRAEGVILGPTSHTGRWGNRAYVPQLGRLLVRDSVEELTIDSLDRDPHEALVANAATELAQEGVVVLGSITEGSSIDDLRVELLSSESATLGQLIWTVDGGNRVYWQISNAKVERSSWGGDSHRSVNLGAAQLGIWDSETNSFISSVTTPPAVGVVFSGPSIGPEDVVLDKSDFEIGLLPGSQFPLVVNARELSLHHVAILGTTGTGKTHLAFRIAEALSKAGAKVICVDTTGQYLKRFPDATITSISDVMDFIDGSESIAVHVPDAGMSNILESRELAKKLFAWAEAQGPLGPNEVARCVLLFEEAQNFIPEQFVVNDWDLKAASQDTARIIMESRKFGLGFILVSQRTAMVTKSALSQCNTVFAFQAFDQTGLDYLEGLCGAPIARSIPTLPRQTAVAVGRGVSSTRPMIVHVAPAEVVIG